MAGSSKAIDVAELAARYAAGESMQTLAAEHSVHRSTLYRWLLAGQGDDKYHELVTHCLVQRVAEADAMLLDESCDIARAREVARYSRMDLERRRPALYGAKPELGALNVTVQVVAFAQQKVLDNQAHASTGVMSNARIGEIVAEQQQPGKHALPEDRGRSPVALPLVDCVGNKSAQGGV